MEAGAFGCANLLYLTVCPPARSRRQRGLKEDNALKLHCTAQSVWTSSKASFPRLLHGDASALELLLKCETRENWKVMPGSCHSIYYKSAFCITYRGVNRPNTKVETVTTKYPKTSEYYRASRGCTECLCSGQNDPHKHKQTRRFTIMLPRIEPLWAFNHKTTPFTSLSLIHL